jgi:hypothetical protein
MHSGRSATPLERRRLVHSSASQRRPRPRRGATRKGQVHVHPLHRPRRGVGVPRRADPPGRRRRPRPCGGGPRSGRARGRDARGAIRRWRLDGRLCRRPALLRDRRGRGRVRRRGVQRRPLRPQLRLSLRLRPDRARRRGQLRRHRHHPARRHRHQRRPARGRDGRLRRGAHPALRHGGLRRHPARERGPRRRGRVRRRLLRPRAAYQFTDRIAVSAEVLQHRFEVDDADADVTTFGVKAAYRF